MSSMIRPADPRIPVAFVASGVAQPGRVLLAEAGFPLPAGVACRRFAPSGAGHAFGCACCGGRSGAAVALAELFLAHARGEIGALDGVGVLAATEAGRAAVLAALGEDRLVRARFRLEG